MTGTLRAGRRMYESMVYWETARTSDQPEVVRKFAQIWRATEKIVDSRTLQVTGHTLPSAVFAKLSRLGVRPMVHGIMISGGTENE
ncbi:hypothetical protein EMIT07CA2_550065 [Brevibacillus sp. IT-7CA2]